MTQGVISVDKTQRKGIMKSLKQADRHITGRSPRVKTGQGFNYSEKGKTVHILNLNLNEPLIMPKALATGHDYFSDTDTGNNFSFDDQLSGNKNKYIIGKN